MCNITVYYKIVSFSFSMANILMHTNEYHFRGNLGIVLKLQEISKIY